jgi:ABC-type multidrug transport system fused ATPase/permease subunit
LILDDALSSVDTYTEEKILAQLRGVMRERTSLIVSHRISTVREADLICVLDEGRIVEQGKPADVLDRPQAERTKRFLRRTLQLADSLEELTIDEGGVR